jgi:hypothetical protein
MLKAFLSFKAALRWKWIENDEIGCISDMAQGLRGICYLGAGMLGRFKMAATVAVTGLKSVLTASVR